MGKCYEMVKDYKKRYPMTIAWRLKKHASVIEKHLNSGEKILYAFPGQKGDNPYSMTNTNIFAFTNKRIIVATKRLLFGYFFKSITPDMYNDLTVRRGFFFGSVTIDTVKEIIHINNVDAKALDEIETNISEIMIKHKKDYMKEEKSAK